MPFSIVRLLVRVLAAGLVMAAAATLPAGAQQAPAGGTTGGQQQYYTAAELIEVGNGFFGDVTAGLASVIERAVADRGQPNGYVLGEEGGGAFFGGLRYGEGTLQTRNAAQQKVFWQGPSLGLDWGADGARTMILVYNLPSVDAIYGRFAGVNGSAYFIGGFGITALTRQEITLVPVRSGIGARIGVNVGYLKFTPTPTWNPF
jgi:hypothetical protein